jgi:hypothetical protein
MTTVAELYFTPSTRERDAACRRQSAAVQGFNTSIVSGSEHYQQLLGWLSRWLLVADHIRFTGPLSECLYCAARPRSAATFWEPIEHAFSGTTAFSTLEPLEPLQRVVTDSHQAGQLGIPGQFGIPKLFRASRFEPNKAVKAMQDLQRWLDLTVDQVAELVGTSKSAIHYWRRENAQPRPGAARNLYRVHALVRALRDATAPDSPLIALTRRPEASEQSAYDLLLARRYEDAEHLLRPLIFRRHEQIIQRPRLISREEEANHAPTESLLRTHPPVRRARRVTLPK